MAEGGPNASLEILLNYLFLLGFPACTTEEVEHIFSMEFGGYQSLTCVGYRIEIEVFQLSNIYRMEFAIVQFLSWVSFYSSAVMTSIVTYYLDFDLCMAVVTYTVCIYHLEFEFYLSAVEIITLVFSAMGMIGYAHLYFY